MLGNIDLLRKHNDLSWGNSLNLVLIFCTHVKKKSNFELGKFSSTDSTYIYIYIFYDFWKLKIGKIIKIKIK